MQFVRGTTKYSIIWGLSSVIGSLTMVMQPQIVKKLFDGYEQKNYTLYLVLLYGVSIVLILLSEYINKHSLLKLSARIKENIRNAIAKCISNENYIVVSEQEVSELNVDINTNIDEVIESYYANVLNLVFVGVSLIFYSVTIFSMDKGMALFVVVPNIISLFIPKLMENNISRKKEEMIDSNEAYNLKFFDFYRGSNILKNLSAVKAWKNHLSDSSKHSIKKEVTYGMEQNLGEMLIGSISYLGVFGMIAYGVFAIINGQMTVGTLVASLQYSDMIAVPIINFSVGLNMLSAGKLLKKRLEERYSQEEQIEDSKKEKETFNSIEVNNLEFGYEDEKRLFSIPQLQICSGDKVLLVGKNGTGKSSFLKVLIRALTKYEGEIKINGHEIKEYSFTEMSSFMNYIPQNDFLFSGSVEENIKILGNETIGEEEREILDITGVSQMLKQNATVEKLSGGEKQRVCLARTLLHKKDILIIDEGLNEIEQALRIKILKWLLEKEKLTFIYISHDGNDYLEGFHKKIEF